jgi:hypothetical protein
MHNGPVNEEAQKAAPAGPSSAEAQQGAPPPATPPGSAPPGGGPGEAVVGASTAVVHSLKKPPNPGPPGGASAIFAAGGGFAGTSTRIIVSQVTGLSCGRSPLEAGAGSTCTTGPLGSQGFLSSSSARGATSVASLPAATQDPPGGSGHGGSAVESPPAGPAPPAPPSGGASGGSMGASAPALSGFLTLAALLLLGGPRAMRRLRLSCEPWLTACFVLIPERPD